MKVNHSRAVSPIIATLLLIAIAVAAGVIVYVFTGSLASSLTKNGGSQVTELIQMQSYTFQISPGTCGCSGKVLSIFLLNAGTGTSTIAAVYYDGTPYTAATPPTSDTALAATTYYTADSAHTLTSGTPGDISFGSGATTMTTYPAQATGQLVLTFTSAPTSGSGHLVKIVTTGGAIFNFHVVAGSSG